MSIDFKRNGVIVTTKPFTTLKLRATKDPEPMELGDRSGPDPVELWDDAVTELCKRASEAGHTHLLVGELYAEICGPKRYNLTGVAYAVTEIREPVAGSERGRG